MTPRVLRTAAPFTNGAPFHASCLAPAICSAIGYQHNPRARYSYRTLGVCWNDSSRGIQKSINN